MARSEKKNIPEYLWMNLLISLKGERTHDTTVVRNFCRVYRYSAKAVWERALEEARQAAEFEPRRVLH